MSFATVLPAVLSVASFFGFGEGQKLSKTAESSVAVIRTPNGGGSGFLVSLDGKKYIVTNQHVLMGVAASDVHITFLDGTQAHPTNPQIVGNLDLARLEFTTDRPALVCAQGNPEIGSRVAAVGNSLDAGVITIGAGKVEGVGANEVEVDCDFVPGNSGGPIVNASEQVVGVATYIKLGTVNAATAGTRYMKNRRFGVRLRDGMPWIAVPQWPVYAATGKAIQDSQLLAEEVMFAAQAIASGADISAFKPRTQKVVSAIGDFDKLRAQFSRLKSNGLTQRELNSSRSTLVAKYRSAFLKLRDACAAGARDLNARPIPPTWAWLAGQRVETVRQLQAIQSALEGEIKRDPPF
jgi:Trypsin-like peptidase domain